MVNIRNYTVVIGLMMVLGTNLTVLGAPGAPGDDATMLAGPSLDFAGGDGSVKAPYQISNVTQLQNMSANLTAHYVLKNDINASATSNWSNRTGFDPIGDAASKFNGSLDGQGFSISGLWINRGSEDYIGLFGYVDQARVVNVTLSSETIKGRNRVGGLCGHSQEGIIDYCSFSGSVEGRNYVGGVIGSGSGGLEDCRVDSRISGDEYAGGLAGYFNGEITRCSSGQTVIGSFRYGGLVGRLVGGPMADSHCSGNVGELSSYYGGVVGGLVGISSGTISNCYSTGNAVGGGSVGGLAGVNTGTISDCYSVGSATGAMTIGGLVGENSGTLSSCYSSGSVLSPSMSRYWQYIGGLVGENRGTIKDCHSVGSLKGEVIKDYNLDFNYIGGFVGWNSGEVMTSSSKGSVSGSISGSNALTRCASCWSSLSFFPSPIRRARVRRDMESKFTRGRRFV